MSVPLRVLALRTSLHTYICSQVQIYFVLVLLMICNRNGITSVGRWEFVKAFVEDFVAILVAIHFATPFATKNDRENFVEISSKISLLQLKFDEIWTNCLTKFWRFFFAAKCCGKTFCHNILPQKKNVKISSKISLLQFKFWRKPNEILTKEFVAKSCGKTFCHKAPDEKSDEILTKWKRKKQQRKSLYQNILQVVGNHGGVRSQNIFHHRYFIWTHVGGTHIYVCALASAHTLRSCLYTCNGSQAYFCYIIKTPVLPMFFKLTYVCALASAHT